MCTRTCNLKRLRWFFKKNWEMKMSMSIQSIGCRLFIKLRRCAYFFLLIVRWICYIVVKIHVLTKIKNFGQSKHYWKQFTSWQYHTNNMKGGLAITGTRHNYTVVFHFLERFCLWNKKVKQQSCEHSELLLYCSLLAYISRQA